MSYLTGFYLKGSGLYLQLFKMGPQKCRISIGPRVYTKYMEVKTDFFMFEDKDIFNSFHKEVLKILGFFKCDLDEEALIDSLVESYFSLKLDDGNQQATKILNRLLFGYKDRVKAYKKVNHKIIKEIRSINKKIDMGYKERGDLHKEARLLIDKLTKANDIDKVAIHG